MSRVIGLEGASSAPSRCLWTDTTVTHHLGNVKYPYLSQEPACNQQKYAAGADDERPKKTVTAAAGETAAAEKGGDIGHGGTDFRPASR